MMNQYLWPIPSFVIGVLLIVFRKNVATWISKIVEAVFPRWKSGVKYLNWKSSVKPVFIAMLGVVYIIVAILGVIEIAIG
jgi:hypothetical protein